ncbi:hypothetical protein GIB67_013259 [Kingdonia uniflora]|uniref:BTB domain-containing protein n=1 Tax=Kingdonia uniflora TaxID=39325 RepID=A0A7J7N665_9MAGN|nr:hypothetical protein GIB67_013259 [Kingdonia uniflora]
MQTLGPQLGPLRDLGIQFEVVSLVKQCEEILEFFKRNKKLFESGNKEEILHPCSLPQRCVVFPFELPINAHKLILSLWSIPFMKMFTNGMRESGSSKIFLSDVSLEAFAAMFQFMYHGDIDMKNSMDMGNFSIQLLLLADQFTIAPLHQECCNTILEYLSEVNGTAVVHCGFCSEKGGFKLSEEDKSYMQTCKVVLSTCTFGGGDDLYQPIGMSQASLEKEGDGKKIDEDRMFGKWGIVIVRDLPFIDQRLNDSKSQFPRDPLGEIEALLWQTNSILAISEYGASSSVYDEAKVVVHKNKAAPEEVDRQMTQYHHDGFPDDKRFYGKKVST